MPLAAFAWPIAFFFDRVWSIGGTLRATANDFIFLSYVYKPYLLDSLVHGRIPLWSPSEALGYPFYSSPFTQTFYPLNAPLALFYWLAGGYSPHDHQVYTALATGLFSLGVYLWLRSLESGAAPALFAACAVSTSLRIADMLRFPNAVHSAAWFPWMLLAINQVLRARTRRRTAVWALALAAFGISMVTAGYPYYVYYSLFLFIPYLAIVSAPGILPSPLLAPDASRAMRIATVAAAGVLAGTVCLPYLLKMRQLLDATAGRQSRPAGADAWYAFTPADTLGSLLFPIGGTPEGGYYFGIAGVLLLVSYIVALWRRRSDPGRKLAAVLLSWLVLLSGLSYGPSSPIYRAAIAVVPGMDRLRAWGRLNIVLLLVVAWLLARACAHLQEQLATVSRERAAAGLSTVLLASALVIAVIQGGLLLVGWAHPYYSIYLPVPAKWAAWCLPAGAAAAAAMVGLVRRARTGHPPHPATLVAVLLLVTATDVWPIASPLWSYQRPRPVRTRFDVATVLRQALLVPRKIPAARGGGSTTYDTLSVDYDRAVPASPFVPAFNVTVIPQWYFDRYARLLDARVPVEPRALGSLLGLDDGRRLFATARLDYPEIQGFLDDAAALAAVIEIRDYTGDRMEAQVRLPRDGFLTFVDNWDPDWHASVDGRPAPLCVAFGTFKAVALVRGDHRVVFEYAPSLWPLPTTPPSGCPPIR